MNLTLDDLRNYVLDNYGQAPIQKHYEWQQSSLYYKVEDGEVCLSLLNYWQTNQQFISFGFERKNHSGYSYACDSLDEMVEYLDKHLKKKENQTSLF